MNDLYFRDGYTQIPNFLIENLSRIRLGNSNTQVLFAIIRKTLGFHKLEDAISISQIQDATNLSRRQVIYALKNLEAKRIIYVDRSRIEKRFNNINQISLNLNPEEWTVNEISPQYARALQERRKRYHSLKHNTVSDQELVRSSKHNSSPHGQLPKKDDTVEQRNKYSEAIGHVTGVSPALQVEDSQQVVQENHLGSERNGPTVVQEIEKKFNFLAPTKEIKKIKNKSTKDTSFKTRKRDSESNIFKEDGSPDFETFKKLLKKRACK